jgi:hypothetical protein
VGSGEWEVAVACSLHDGLSLIGMGLDSTTLIRLVPRGDIVRPFGHNVISGFTFIGNGNNLDQWVRAILPVYEDDVRILDNRFRDLYTGIGGEFTGRIENNIFEDNERAIDGSFDACSLLVKNNSFRCGRRSAIEGWKGQWTVLNNIFYACSVHLSGYILGLNMYLPQDSSYIAGNLFYRNDAGDDDNLAQIALSNNVAFENNTIVGFIEAPVHSAIEFWAYWGSTLKSTNNIIAGYNYAFLSSYGDSTNELYYNCLWNNRHLYYYGIVDTVIGNIFSDPMFIDTADYHLQAFSPLIDAGDPSILDVDGTRSDIGAYGGPFGASYSYLDIAPKIPDSLSAQVRGDTAYITWRPNTEADFARYMVFRDTVTGFIPSVFNLVAEPETSLYIDTGLDTLGSFFYRIAALDNQDNLSDYSNELAVIFTGLPGFGDTYLPKISYIEKNYPNPFNSVTIINYHLADLGYQPAEVKLLICDIGGRLIKTLVEQRQYPGDYRVSWDGRGEGGQAVTSGIYFARLIVSGIELARARKITLVK